MAKENKSRRQYLTLQAIDPKDGTLTAEIMVSFDRMQAVARRSLGHAKECGHIIPAILDRPSAIFEGLRRDEDEDRKGFGWRCYCGIPTNSYHHDGSEGCPYPGQVYLVFINDECVAYNWRWEKADPDNLCLPIDHATRFQKQLL